MKVIDKASPPVKNHETIDVTTTIEEVAPINDKGMLTFHKIHLLETFELKEPIDKKIGDQLIIIHEYLIERGATEAEYIHQLREIRLRLGTPNLGQTLHANVYAYVRLLGQKELLDKAIGELER